MTLSHDVLVAIFAVLLIPGLLGVALPVLPGIPYMLLVAVVFGFVDRFRHMAWWELVILTLIALLSLVVDHASGILGAKYGGAGKRAMLAGMLGFLVGLIAFPPFGGFIGLFLGVLISELASHKDTRRAARAATGSLLGSLAGVLANLILGILFIALFVLFAL